MSVDSPLTQPASTDQLIEACLRGDQQAWDAIVSKYRRRVFNVAYKFVGRHDEAEDLTQDIFVNIFKALHTFDRRANFQTWLISISRNRCIDHYRSVRKEWEAVERHVDAADLSPLAKGPDALKRLEHLDRRALLRQAFTALPSTLRSAVVLRDLRELSYQEIATRLALPEGTVKSRINRGRHELARHIVKLERERDAIVTERANLTADTPSSGVRE